MALQLYLHKLHRAAAVTYKSTLSRFKLMTDFHDLLICIAPDSRNAELVFTSTSCIHWNTSFAGSVY